MIALKVMKVDRQGRRRVHWVPLVLAVLVVLTLVQFVSNARLLDQQQEKLSRLSQQLGSLEMQNEDLRGKLAYAQSLEGIEQKARELLGLVYPDEILYEQKPGAVE